MRHPSARLTAAFALALAVAAARADVTVTVINTGTPKVPTSVDPSGLMTGYTGYIIHLETSVGVITSYDFGLANTGIITGTFAQVWTASNADAISGGAGYDTFSPGVSTANNSNTTLLNADTHFLGDPSRINSNLVENAAFPTINNPNPFAPKSNDIRGYGTGTQLRGLVGILGAYQSSNVDAVYLVTPTGTPFSFTDAQVAVSNQYQASYISYPNVSTYASWNSSTSDSWANSQKWSAGLVPQTPGAIVTFGPNITSPIQITLDGDRTLSRLEFSTYGPVTIAPGTGGKLLIDNGPVPANILAGSGNEVIAVPVQLNSSLRIGRYLNGAAQANAPGSLEFAAPISSLPGADTPINLRNETFPVIFSANNTYTGATNVLYTLQIGNGGTTGSLGTGDVFVAGTLLFNRSDSFTVNNNIFGAGTLTQSGPGTVTLTGAANFTGATRTLNGQLILDNTGNRDSSKNAVFPTSLFLISTPAVSNWATPQGSLANIGVSSSGGLQTAANLRAGKASAQSLITLRFRTRTPAESATLASDVLDLSGMTRPSTTQTDPFALELSYSDAALQNEAAAALAGTIFLGWLTPDAHWVNAVDGNFDQGTTVLTNFQGSWQSFASAFGVTDTNVGNFLGSWGVDTISNTTWAVINHNSQFSVSAIPEPASLATLALAALPLLRRKPRHKTP